MERKIFMYGLELIRNAFKMKSNLISVAFAPFKKDFWINKALMDNLKHDGKGRVFIGNEELNFQTKFSILKKYGEYNWWLKLCLKLINLVYTSTNTNIHITYIFG